MHDTDTLRQSEPAGRRSATLALAALAGATLLLAACGGGGGSPAPAAQPKPQPAAEEPKAEAKPEPAAKYDPVHGPYDPSVHGPIEVEIERNSFDNIAAVFALGHTAERHDTSFDPRPSHLGGSTTLLEGGEIYMRWTDAGDVPTGGRFKVEQGTHIRETEHRRVSYGKVIHARRDTVATGARIEREGRNDYVTFGWWYRMVGQHFVDSAPDHGRPSSVHIRAFADGPEFRRVPDTFPTGLAEYEGPAIGLHTIEKDGNRTTKEFSGTATFGVSYSGERFAPSVLPLKFVA